MKLMQIHELKKKPFGCKGENELTSCKIKKESTVNEGWELAKKMVSCFWCL